MTRRARWTRPLAALFALWFAFVIGDPGLLHDCPMHGGHGGVIPVATSGAEHHAPAQGGHASMDHASMGHASSHDASHHGQSAQCTCVGQCCMAASVAPLPAVSAMHVPAVVALAEPAPVIAFVVAPAAPDIRLPFPNGPPAA